MNKIEDLQSQIIDILEQSVKDEVIPSVLNIPDVLLEVHAKYIFGLVGANILNDEDTKNIIEHQKRKFNWTLDRLNEMTPELIKLAKSKMDDFKNK